MWRDWRAILGAWRSDAGGSLLPIVGLGATVLAMAVVASVEYGSLAGRRSTLQKAADAAAIAATQQLRLSNNTDSVVESTVQTVLLQNAPVPNGTSRAVTTEILNGRTSVRVTARETVSSIMGRLLSMPTMDIAATAAAQLSGTSKLCLVTLDKRQKQALNLDKDSLITASGCAIYSNSKDKEGLSADRGAQATAAMICSAGGVKNKSARLYPTPNTDCPGIGDPLRASQAPAIGACLANKLTVSSSQTLDPGNYCGGLQIKGTAQVTLRPGVYVINDGPLIVTDQASLTGQDVGFYFTGDLGGARFDPDTTISLAAPRSGEMAGLLFFEDGYVSNPVPLPPGPKGSLPPPPLGSQPMRQYRITSNNAPTLLGTIYLPAGRLVIDSNRPVAERSAYTVIVARQLDLNSGPNLYLNSNYAGSDVPVPQGVGSNSGTVSLSQ
ncbi:MAG: hypothetical protein JO048_04735 [Methylobacteriaceae bacterium]|nr:hypothetical protein [Methylobacteriaceae bacterium]